MANAIGTAFVQWYVQNPDVQKVKKFFKEVLNPQIIKVGLAVVGVFTGIVKSLQEFGKAPKALKDVHKLKILNFLKFPFILNSLASKVDRVAQVIKKPKKFSPEDKLDLGLEVASNVGDLGNNIASVASALAALNLVPAASVAWTTPLGYAMIPLAVAGYVLSVKNFVQASIFTSEFNKATHKKEAGEALDNTIELLKNNQARNKKYVKKYLDADAEKLLPRLEQVQRAAKEKIESGNTVFVEQGKKEQAQAMRALKERVSTQIANQALGVLIGTIAMIATAILFTPVSWVSTILFAGIGVVSLGMFIAGKIQAKRLEKDLNIE